MHFRELNIVPTILSALQAKGYESPTPIQAAAIPTVLAGKDLLGCAQTGTGKTAAFAVPMLQNLAARVAQGPKRIRALVLAPTRELALQIGESFQAYGQGLNLRTTTIFGGVSDFGQKQKLRQGVDILVATPGRLKDLYEQRALSLANVEIFVLDEADRMMDMGFIHDVRFIASLLPAKRQTLFFSATMPPEIRALSKSLLHDPVQVEVARVSSTAENIEQSVYHVSRNLKPSLLRHLLADGAISRALVFTRTKHGADRVCKVLERHNISADAIHGNKTQGARQRALAGFKDGTVRILVATDIAARGIDVSEVSHVFNYDLPEVAETYVHRIGRTARAGASGVAVAFCDVEERGYLTGIERLTRARLRVLPTPTLQAEAPVANAPRHAQGARKPGSFRQDRPRFDRHERGGRPGHSDRNERGERPAVNHEAPRPYAHSQNAGPSQEGSSGPRFGRRGPTQSTWQKSGSRFGGRR